MTLKVFILGNGGAAKKHRAAFAELPKLYEMVDDYDAADVIDVCTPNCLHFTQARDALLSGRHAIVEKPVAGSLAEVDELILLEVKTAKRVCPVFQYRYSAPKVVDDTLHSGWPRDPSYWRSWRGVWSMALGGCLTSHGIHLIDLLLQKHGLPRKIWARTDCQPLAVETFATIDLYWNDLKGHISVALGPHIKPPDLNLGDPSLGYRVLFQRFVSNHGPTIVEARDGLAVLTASYYSAYTEELVTLPLKPEHPFYRGWMPHFAQQSQQSPVSH